MLFQHFAADRSTPEHADCAFWIEHIRIWKADILECVQLQGVFTIVATGLLSKEPHLDRFCQSLKNLLHMFDNLVIQ